MKPGPLPSPTIETDWIKTTFTFLNEYFKTVSAGGERIKRSWLMHRFVHKDFKLNREGIDGLEKCKPLALRAVKITRSTVHTQQQGSDWRCISSHKGDDNNQTGDGGEASSSSKVEGNDCVLFSQKQTNKPNNGGVFLRGGAQLCSAIISDCSPDLTNSSLSLSPLLLAEAGGTVQIKEHVTGFL